MATPAPQSDSTPLLTRRRVLAGTVGLAGGAALAGYAGLPQRVLRRLGLGPEPWIPDVPAGQVRLESVRSAARGREVDLFTAVPHGHGDGAGLPVVVVLHGATATPADFAAYGLGRFLTAAVRRGAAPFVLAGAGGGVLYWEPDPNSDDNPQAMVLEELPGWLQDRGFDASTRALWGWSMGGYGALRLAEVQPGWARAVASFSPAVSPGDPVFANAGALAATPLGIWCGADDPLYDDVRALVDALPQEPEVTSFGPGGHDRFYWNEHMLGAFDWLARHLSA